MIYTPSSPDWFDKSIHAAMPQKIIIEPSSLRCLVDEVSALNIAGSICCVYDTLLFNR